MKFLRIAIALLGLLSAAALAQSDAQKSFTQLKTLVGSWEGKMTTGQPAQVVFRVTSGGSALLSEIQGEEDMITMIHPDGNRLLLTHYCGAGNQPRMQATASPDGKTFTFDFLDATNLVAGQPGHMHRVVFTIVDADHHTEDWTFTAADGKEQHERFDLQRKK